MGTVYFREVCDYQIWRYFHLNQTANYGYSLYPLTGLGHLNVYKYCRGLPHWRKGKRPRHSLSTYGRRAFVVAGPTAWNSFPDNFRDPDLTTDNFKLLFKTFLRTSAIIALDVSRPCAL